MTFDASHALMLPFQGKPRQGVVKFLFATLFLKTGLIVTGRTVQPKSPLVRVLMTADTGDRIDACELAKRPLGATAAVVAFPALQIAVFTLQDISRQIVVEPGTRYNFFERGLDVTAFAGITVMPLVDVVVTRCAASEINALKLLKAALRGCLHRMAGFAVYLLMCSGQGEFRPVVVKQGRGFPTLKTVTFLTIIGQGVAVAILMTGNTIGL